LIEDLAARLVDKPFGRELEAERLRAEGSKSSRCRELSV